MRVVEGPCFFFLGASSSSSSSSSGRCCSAPLPLSGALPLTGFLAVTAELLFLPLAGFSSTSSSSGSGSSTTKRYLHLGQSIFLPIRPESRIGTIASQLGHCCLKLVLLPDAMIHSRRAVGGTVVGERGGGRARGGRSSRGALRFMIKDDR